jgi:hypothetical protein
LGKKDRQEGRDFIKTTYNISLDSLIWERDGGRKRENIAKDKKVIPDPIATMQDRVEINKIDNAEFSNGITGFKKTDMLRICERERELDRRQDEEAKLQLQNIRPSSRRPIRR